ADDALGGAGERRDLVEPQRMHLDLPAAEGHPPRLRDQRVQVAGHLTTPQWKNLDRPTPLVGSACRAPVTVPAPCWSPMACRASSTPPLILCARMRTGLPPRASFMPTNSAS